MDEACFSRGTYSSLLKVVEQVSGWLPYHAFHAVQCDVAVKKTLFSAPHLSRDCTTVSLLATGVLYFGDHCVLCVHTNLLSVIISIFKATVLV
jgi:hypothetical protein